MLHLLLSLSFAASPRVRCEEAITKLIRAPLVATSLDNTALLRTQLAADQKGLRRAERRCAARAREAPAQVEEALGRAAYARGVALRDAPGVPAEAESFRLSFVSADWSAAQEHWNLGLSQSQDPSLIRTLKLELLALSLERQELSKPPAERVAWTDSSITARAFTARERLSRLSSHEICVEPGLVQRRRALLSQSTETPGWWVDHYGELLQLEESFQATGTCDPRCLHAVDTTYDVLQARPDSWLELDAALLSARALCVPSRVPDLVLEFGALSAAASNALRASEGAVGVEKRSFELRAALESAEARRLAETAVALAPLRDPKHVELVAGLGAGIPSLPPPPSGDSAADQAIFVGMQIAACVPSERQPDAAWLLFLAAPMAEAGVLLQEGKPLIDRFKALSSGETCAQIAGCLAALDAQRALRIDANPQLPRKQYDKALTEALKTKVSANQDLERACAPDEAGDPGLNAARMALMASGYEDLASSISNSPIPPYLTADQAEIYRMSRDDRVYPPTLMAQQALERVKSLDPQRFARLRALESAPILAEQERERAGIMASIERYGSPEPPRRRPNRGPSREAVASKLDELEAQMSQSAACLSPDTLEEDRSLIESGREIVAVQEVDMYADMFNILSDAQESLRAEIRANCGAEP